MQGDDAHKFKYFQHAWKKNLVLKMHDTMLVYTPVRRCN